MILLLVAVEGLPGISSWFLLGLRTSFFLVIAVFMGSALIIKHNPKLSCEIPNCYAGNDQKLNNIDIIRK